jgi:hypothetical protein
MTDFSIGAAFGAGFGLMRRRPLSVLAWGLISATTTLVLTHPYTKTTPVMGILGRGGALDDNIPFALQALRTWIAQCVRGVPETLVTTAFHAILACAACRAVLRPSDRAFAYLRLGRAELFVWLLILAVDFLWYVPLAVQAVLLGTTSGGSLSLELYGELILAFKLGTVLVGAYPYIRFSLVGAMIVDDDRFHLLRSWQVTEGRAGRLFGLAALVFATAAAATLIRFAIVGSFGSLNFLSLYHVGLTDLLTHPTLPMVVSAALTVPLSAFVLTVATAPWARVYRDLTSGPDVDEVFA